MHYTCVTVLKYSSFWPTHKAPNKIHENQINRCTMYTYTCTIQVLNLSNPVDKLFIVIGYVYLYCHVKFYLEFSKRHVLAKPKNKIVHICTYLLNVSFCSSLYRTVIPRRNAHRPCTMDSFSSLSEAETCVIS